MGMGLRPIPGPVGPAQLLDTLLLDIHSRFNPFILI